MNNFEIIIQRKTGETWPIVVEYSQPGEFLPIRIEGTLHLSQQDFLELLSLLGQPRDYGVRLGKKLFGDGVRDAFVSARNKSSEPLRVLLYVEDDSKELRNLRWQRLCAPIDNHWQLLALNQQTPFSLYIPAITDRLFPPIGRRDLRALVLVASPSGLERYRLSPFDVKATVESVKQALGEIPCDVLAAVDGAIGPPTLDQLCEQLTRDHYTLLHFVCHGKLVEDGETVLYWATADNQVDVVAGTRLLERLRTLREAGARGLPHFTFLSSCESASSEAEVALGGLGQRLVRDLGMPAVVAMTEKVTIKTAQALAASFYRQLRQSGEVDSALVEATAGLAERGDITVPVLFSRLGGRPLFSDQLDRDLTNSEIQFGLERFQSLLNDRAPVLKPRFDKPAQILKMTLGADASALSLEADQERERALLEVNDLSMEVLDLSFNALALGQEPPAYDTHCPFLGLYPFQLEDREFFFGREQLIETLQQKLTEHNFLAVLGASGCGKSSVVLAGLIPQLQVKEKDLQMGYLTPSSEPLVKLKETLSALPPTQTTVLVIDQFEELFTLCADQSKRVKFIDQLLSLIQQMRVVITMRSDFLGECAPYRELKELMQARLELVPPMDSQELRQTMDKQASQVGLRFEANLSNSILDDVQGEPGAMPLLQHALLELWKRRHGRWLRSQEYENIGGVKQAIANTADDVYASLSANEKRQFQNIFVRLTRLDEGAVQGEKRRDTRRRVKIEELVLRNDDPEVTKQLVKRLADQGARLVVTSVDQATSREEVEVAHEALIRYWPRLQNWLAENRTNLQLRENIRLSAQEWEQHQREESYLVHRGGRLEDAQALSRQAKFLNQLEDEYVKACVELRDRQEREKEESRQRELETARKIAQESEARRKAEEEARKQAEERTKQEQKALKAAQATTRVTAGASVVVLGFTIIAGYQWRNAQEHTVKALAETSEASLLSNRQLEALVAAVQSGKQSQNPILFLDPATRQTASAALQRAVYNVQEHNRLEGHSDSVTSVVFSPDGKTLASASFDGTVKLWSIDGRELKRLPGQNQSFRRIIFSPDGKMIAAISANNTIKAWNIDGQELITLNGKSSADNYTSSLCISPDGKVIAAPSSGNTVKLWSTSGQELKVLKGHQISVWSVSCSPDGKTIVTADQGGVVKIWSTDGRELKTFRASNLSIYDVSFSPDGKSIATAAGDTTVKLWSLDGKEIRTLGKHDNYVTSVSFSRDGKTIASTSADRTVKLWRSATGQEIKTFRGHNDTIFSVSFSPNGKFIASDAGDNTVKLWSIDDEQKLKTFVGHRDSLWSVGFSPNGKIIASAGDDKTIRLWSLDGQELRTINADSDQPWNRIWSLSFSPDGNTLATSNYDTTIKLWNLDGQNLKTFKGHKSEVTDVSFSPNGQTLASASYDGTVKLWRVEGQEFRTLKASSGKVWSVSFSPDGKTLASAHHDGTVKLWNLQNRRLLRTIPGHGSDVKSVRFSPDGKIIASASRDKTVKLWSLEGQELKILKGHSAEVTKLSFSPDSKILASSSADGTIRLWSVTDGQEIKTIEGHGYPYWNVSFSPDGKKIVSVSDDALVELWNAETLNEAQLIARGCNWLHDYLKNNSNVAEKDKHICD